MTGKNSGLVARVCRVAPNARATHCVIQREALAAKRMPRELHEVLKESIKVIYFIEGRPLKARLFTLLCQDLESKHEQLLFRIGVR